MCLAVHAEDDVHRGGFVGSHEMGEIVVSRVHVQGGEEVGDNGGFFLLVVHAETQNKSPGFSGLSDSHIERQRVEQ